MERKENETRKRENDAFSMGWKHGNDWGSASWIDAWNELKLKVESPTETEIELFCQGSDDGARGDCFRLHFNLNPLPPCCAAKRSQVAR